MCCFLSDSVWSLKAALIKSLQGDTILPHQGPREARAQGSLLSPSGLFKMALCVPGKPFKSGHRLTLTYQLQLLLEKEWHFITQHAIKGLRVRTAVKTWCGKVGLPVFCLATRLALPHPWSLYAFSCPSSKMVPNYKMETSRNKPFMSFKQRLSQYFSSQ